MSRRRQLAVGVFCGSLAFVLPWPVAYGQDAAPVRVCAGGDVTLGTDLDTAFARTAASRLRPYGLRTDPEDLLAPLRPIVADADVVLLNVETAIGSGPFRSKCGPRSTSCYAFRGPPSAAAAMGRLGRDSAAVVGNLANNHARDAGPAGLTATVAHLRSAGMQVTGLDTLATPVPLRSGDTLGVLGFYTSTETPDLRDLAAVRRHVARAATRYGTVIVTAHMGAEGIGAQRTGDSVEYFLSSRINRGNPVAFARAAFESGAALVVGHGPHVLRGAEWSGDRLALYSLGNLLTFGPFNNSEPINRGAVVCADVREGRVIGAHLRPTLQVAPGVLRADATLRALTLIDSLGALDFPLTAARIDPWGEMHRPLLALDAAGPSGPNQPPSSDTLRPPRR